MQKIIYQMFTQIWGLKFYETIQYTIDIGGQICSDTTEDGIFCIPLFGFKLKSIKEIVELNSMIKMDETDIEMISHLLCTYVYMIRIRTIPDNYCK